MSQYRLHIDIPLSTDGKVPTEVVEKIMTVFDKSNFCVEGIQCVNYRLGHDDDRQRSNYLDINENGHCSNRKSKIVYD
jgi:hypothetical protein